MKRSVKFGILALVFVFQSCATGYMLPPGNFPGGPNARSQVHRSSLAQYSLGGGMESYLNYIAAAPGYGMQAMLYHSVKTPVYATEIPEGPLNLEYTSACYYWVCAGSKTLTELSAFDPIVAVHSVDVHSRTMFFYTFAFRKLIINGWTKSQWEKQFGKVSNIPPGARIFSSRVEMADGNVYENALAVKDGDNVSILTREGESREEKTVNIKSINRML